MRRRPTRLLTLAGLLLLSCGPEPSSLGNGLYVSALGALRDSLAGGDSTVTIPVQAEALKVGVNDVPAAGTAPYHYDTLRLDALAEFADTAPGWSLCPAPASGCVHVEPSSFLALSQPRLSDGDSAVVWATYWRRFPPGSIMSYEISYWKVILRRTENAWRADPAVFIGAEP